MADSVRRQIEEIKTLADRSLADRSLAYASLLHLQRSSADDPTSLEALSAFSPSLIPLLLSDAHRHEEEIAAQALKCLGFMLYHPSLVASISERDVGMVLDSLAELITTTRMKAICNLGVWCISVQQLSPKFLENHIHALLRAVVHALDNPFGSLATTFEGIQAVMKLSDELYDKMRELSNIWLPPIYRRLISRDKRERDMAERCILKTKTIILPPSSALSEFVETDLKKHLLPRMIDLLHDHGQKVHLIQAWGWYIHLLDSNTMSNRHLVNKLLKIPEQTFTDSDPQVQIASLVAWEGFIDALLPAQVLDLETMRPQVGGFQQTELKSSMSVVRQYDNIVSNLVRRIKVIMVPVLGLLSRKSDISVRSFCLSTWHYLLHRLDLLINHPSVVKISLMPILQIIFSRGPDCRSICVWNSCINLLDEFVLSKVKDGKMNSVAERSLCLFDKTFATGSHVHFKSSLKHYPIKWLPWEINNLNDILKMISYICSQELLMTMAPEKKTKACNAALRIFISVLQGVQVEFKRLSTHYDGIQFCITCLLRFVRCMCDDMTSQKVLNQCSDLVWMALQFIKAIRDEIDPSILASLLYHVPLDLTYIKMQSPEDIGSLKIHGPEVSFLVGTDTVSPMVYTTILSLSVVAQSIQYIADIDVLSRALEHLKFLIFPVNSSINLHAVICFFYMHVGKPVQHRLQWLTVWTAIAKGLKETIDSADGREYLKLESVDAGYNLVHWFLCYPLLTSLSPEKSRVPSSVGSCSQLSLFSLQRDLELEFVMDVWKSLFDSASGAAQSEHSSMNIIIEGLCKTFIELLDDNGTRIKSCLKEKYQNTIILNIFGEAVIHLLKSSKVLSVTMLKSSVIIQESGSYEHCSPIKHVLTLVARFLGLLLSCMEANPQADDIVICRIFSALSCLVGRICSRQDIVLLMEIISDPVAGWLSLYASMFEKIQGGIIRQLQCLWVQTLECFQRSCPPIVFDSFFLGIQAPLLQATLDHPHLPISEASITFWKATYGQKTNLRYPQCLCPVLDMLSRNGRLPLRKENTIKKSHNDNGSFDIANMGLREKRLKITKHPIRDSAHQGSLPDICGSDFGEYMEFSGVSRNPVKNQEVRKSEFILEMLRKVS